MFAQIIAALAAIPKILDRLDALIQAIQDKRDQEIKAALMEINGRVEKITNDQQRLELMHQLADLEQRRKP
jgi:hypothetical protein